MKAPRTMTHPATAAAPSRDTLAFYTHPTSMTTGGKHTRALRDLPDDIGALASIAQGLLIHEYLAPAYGFDVPAERRFESHIRPLERMLDRLLAIDSRPMTEARMPDKRLIGACHHFALFLVGVLRAKGTPARARCGFGAYFNHGYFEDHWVCEYWLEDEARWVIVDPQFDELWRRTLKIEHDVLDVPRDQFLVAADAWRRCRDGETDPARFGIFHEERRGLWFVAGDLVHDVAALNKVEMLPWDVWGAMPKTKGSLPGSQFEFFDRLAALTAVPDQDFARLRSLYGSDVRLHVPPTVFNAILNRQEPV